MSNLLNELISIRSKLAPIDRNSVKTSLASRFLLPPFSVLDARQGYWQKRKSEWLALGGNLHQEEENNLLLDMSASARNIKDPVEKAKYNAARRRRKVGDVSGNGLLGISEQARSHYKKTNDATHEGNSEIFNRYGGKRTNTQGGTSVFDPVLCEAMYRWFCPKGGKVLDPFAGGDMQGIVAGCIGRSYHGVDLREKQVLANRKRKELICPEADVKWVVGDSYEIDRLLEGRYDFILSNPPYADLEVYSDDPRDLSTLGYRDFLQKYKDIVAKCCRMLKNNRFAFFLVGEVRDKETGVYYNFVGDTIQAFLDCGMKYYNEAILVTSVGSLPIRVNSMFKDYRKLGKSHQNILVFIKGDPEQACLECGEIDVDDLTMPNYIPVGLAICEEDIKGTIGIQYLEKSDTDVKVIELPLMEACLLCDWLRVDCIGTSKPIPRIWLGTKEGWKRLEDLVELTYVVGGIPYLSREVFPDASIPPVEKPTFGSWKR